ncbi:MAG: bifunctional D-glycero-beta-D-manno-heptose-7-phosphate kinase/D-glycero-beta-D-manno-heptose 1-phosphate adenylyltransferase HldE [Gammaproteobacteria bacterium]|nr:bifunctional D-glycero-beta-D-manno-heptose-7-phosphate kinase/D-glycero-beta-D-manno-heptose 1-phosphate adenylyltransferase HldE [Gammaproteobacteria bacterium]
MPFPSFENTNVLVVGDAMLDRYWHGSADRVSAEAPVPVVKVAEVEDRPGGAANVALNIVALGGKASLVSVVGKDQEARILRNKLETAGINCVFHESDSERTTTKLRVISKNQQLIRADFEDIRDQDQAVIFRLVESVIDQVQVIVLSDYDKGVITAPEQIIRLAREKKIPVLVDPKYKNFSIYKGATVLKPNRPELGKAVGAWHTEEDMVNRCKQLIGQLELGALLVTRDTEGMTLIESGSAPEAHFPAHSREVYDESGAGDTVVAVFAAAIAAGCSFPEATRLANIGAGIAVSHMGVVSVSAPELRREAEGGRRSHRGIMTLDQLRIAVKAARDKGDKIVFTNGCFDILHAGHVDYLEEARQLGDRLIVAINGDASVTRLKGEGRPINPLDRRMIMLAGLASVDWVVSFDGDTPESLLTEIQPDILVKGGDYAMEEVVGAELVKSWGGEVKVVSLVEGCSTTSLVEQIRQFESPGKD